eukprot:6038517-Pyramimonas_sp.AAC.2
MVHQNVFKRIHTSRESLSATWPHVGRFNVSPCLILARASCACPVAWPRCSALCAQSRPDRASPSPPQSLPASG